ncbi:MAG: hypothetical protein DRP14_04025 [Candidatus Aenigmatarchaeota archaeon]|nr:MAG: hypothetical protein DRO41_00610 [Candidatus Bathyarchaeota archaeon]RLJ04067.1 MAG: hypothetical protein DRP14_04025 [Candidatus Aenigmarchaeota archaeon]
MGDAIKERPIATELCVLEKTISGLEEAVNALRNKASIYLKDASAEDEAVESGSEFCPTAFILDTLRHLTNRVDLLRSKVNDMYNRLV